MRSIRLVSRAICRRRHAPRRRPGFSRPERQPALRGLQRRESGHSRVVIARDRGEGNVAPDATEEMAGEPVQGDRRCRRHRCRPRRCRHAQPRAAGGVRPAQRPRHSRSRDVPRLRRLQAAGMQPVASPRWKDPHLDLSAGLRAVLAPSGGAQVPVLVDPTDSFSVYTVHDVDTRYNPGFGGRRGVGIAVVVLGVGILASAFWRRPRRRRQR